MYIYILYIYKCVYVCGGFSDDYDDDDSYYIYYTTLTPLHYTNTTTGESTPSYLLHSTLVIPRIQAVSPWVRLLVMLRNPVDRAYSQYQMCVDMSCPKEQMKVRGLSSYINRCVVM